MTVHLHRWVDACGRVLAGIAFATLAAAFLGGCSTPPVRHHTPVPARTAIVTTAHRMLGHPYRYGGDGPSGFDCSGLAHYSYAHAGIRIPRTVRQQYRHAVHVRHLHPGDLVFFHIHGRSVSHVGIYIGHGRFIHAPTRGSRVTTASLDSPYWRRRFAGGGRYH
ncbi:MAG TPA: C40 family peptidase [Gammaproteobacteria bacterium]|nr:C40 family peptidase [Gammaproteobacteria bacterium]